MILTSNVLNEKETKFIIKQTLDIISTTLKSSLGPYGCNTILEDVTSNHTITKDGLTIFKKVDFDNEVAKTILNIIQKISKSLVAKVGDGSTSAVIVSCELYYRISEVIEYSKLSPKIIMDIIHSIGDTLEKHLKKNAIKITDDNFDRLENIASVSNNNDEKLGKLVASLYKSMGYDSFINLEINKKGNEDYFETSKGYEVSRGYLSDMFATDKNKLKFEAENVNVLICNDTITSDDIEKIGDLIGMSCLQRKEPLIIIAKDYDIEVVNFFKINKIKNKDELLFCPLDFPCGTDAQRAELLDLSIYLGGMMWDKYYTDSPITDFDSLGKCKKIIITEKSSVFIEGNSNTEDIEDRIKEMDNIIEELSLQEGTDDRIFNLERRKGKMRSKSATLYVGGETMLEKNNRMYLLEDSIYACRSALQNGYTVGGNLSIPFLINNDTECLKDITANALKVITNIYLSNDKKVMLINDILSCISESFCEGYICVLDNAYHDKEKSKQDVTWMINDKTIKDLNTGKVQDIEDTPIINSVSTDIEIMKSAISIIGLLVTSNQFICKSTLPTSYRDMIDESIKDKEDKEVKINGNNIKVTTKLLSNYD